MVFTQILFILIVAIIYIPLNGLLLKLIAKMFKLHDQSYKIAFFIALAVGVVAFIMNLIQALLPNLGLWITGVSLLLVNVVTEITGLKMGYGLPWGKTLSVWIVWLVLGFVLALLVGLVFAPLAIIMGQV